MRARLSPLVRRADLAPGESLVSLLARLQQLNHYAPYDFIHELCREGAEPDGDLIGSGDLSTGHSLARLSDLTQIDPVDLYTASPHVFLRVQEPEAYQAVLKMLAQGRLPLRLPTHPGYSRIRVDSNATFCPECLQQAAYHRLAWLPDLSAACLEHKRLLAERCPKCWWLVTVQDVVAARCHRCDTHLTSARTWPIADDPLGLFSQQLVQFLLAVAGRPASWGRAAFPSQVPQTLFVFLEEVLGFLAEIPEALLSAYMRGETSDAFVFDRGLTIDGRYARTAGAVRILATWPEGFYELMDMVLDVLYANGRLSLDRASYAEAWFHDESWYPFPFAQAALAQYRHSLAWPLSGVRLSRPHKRQLTGAFAYLTLGGASRQIGTSTEMIHRLVEIGRFTKHRATREKFPDGFVPQSEVQQVAQQWNQQLALAEASQWVGLSEATVIELADLGKLVAYRGRSKNKSDWRFSKSAIGEFLGRIARRAAPDHAEPLRPRDLWYAAAMTASVGISLAQLLNLVINGQLHACQNKFFYPANLERLTFDAQELEALIEATKVKNGWLTRKEVAQQLGVTKQAVTRLIRDEVLKPVATFLTIQYFDRSVIEQLQSSPDAWAHFATDRPTRPMARH